jgi:hypothetical protein
MDMVYLPGKARKCPGQIEDAMKVSLLFVLRVYHLLVAKA